VRVIVGLWLSFPWDIVQVISGRLDRSLSEHRAIIDAVREGDVQTVRTVFEEHIQRSYLGLSEHLGHGAEDDPFDLAVD
jgi:DNA-binding GntR family transcriptional regulator